MSIFGYQVGSVCLPVWLRHWKKKHFPGPLNYEKLLFSFGVPHRHQIDRLIPANKNTILYTVWMLSIHQHTYCTATSSQMPSVRTGYLDTVIFHCDYVLTSPELITLLILPYLCKIFTSKLIHSLRLQCLWLLQDH